MAIWNIETVGGRYLGKRNSGETPTEAIAAFVSDRLEPVWCRCHAEIARQHTAPVGEMGFYYPSPAPFRPSEMIAVQMREVYMGGGYCVVQAG